MWNTHPDKIVKMIQVIAGKHRGEMHSLYLDWELKQTYHPRYESKIEQWLPMLVIDWK